MKDLAEVGFPFQVSGAATFLVGLILQNWPLVWLGGILHIVGDTFFFFQMKRQGCL